MKYSEIFRAAWKNVLDDFQAGTTCIESEADLQCLLFSECMKILRENPVRPIPVHAEAAAQITHSGGTTHIDLALGPNMELLVELEPNKYDYENHAKQALDKLKDAFQEKPSAEGIFLCLTKNVENKDSVRSYLKDLPSRMQKEGFEVESCFVYHPMHEQCYANRNSQIHCAILIWKER